MGYPNFGKVRTIVLPAPPANRTLEEYKNEYGIDLKSMLTITDGNYIAFKPEYKNALILIDFSPYILANDYPEDMIGLMPTVSAGLQEYDSEVQSAMLSFDHAMGNLSFVLEIDKDSALNLDNVKMYVNEI